MWINVFDLFETCASLTSESGIPAEHFFQWCSDVFISYLVLSQLLPPIFDWQVLTFYFWRLCDLTHTLKSQESLCSLQTVICSASCGLCAWLAKNSMAAGDVD
eukprot:s5144_g4.t1